MSDPIRVVVVDDSALMRHVLSEILNADSDIEVVATARDPFDAREKIKLHNPDVLTLDVEMPRMDGLQFLRNLMRLRPMPVVMVSSLTTKSAEVTLEALRLGAIDFVAKPEVNIAHKLVDAGSEIIAKVKTAAVAKVSALASPVRPPKVSQPAAAGGYRTTDQIIAIGASTGGTEAIREVLEVMPSDSPGIVVVQHIPGMFSASFADRLDSCCDLVVREAQHDERILRGHAYIAPGERHLKVIRCGAQYRCQLSDQDPVNRHRPSVDVLFHSVAQAAKRNATAVMLTGMGKDGAKGMKAMHDAGAYTIAQSEQSSVVWGMPGAAVALGATDSIRDLKDIGPLLCSMMRERVGSVTVG